MTIQTAIKLYNQATRSQVTRKELALFGHAQRCVLQIQFVAAYNAALGGDPNHLSYETVATVIVLTP